MIHGRFFFHLILIGKIWFLYFPMIYFLLTKKKCGWRWIREVLNPSPLRVVTCSLGTVVKLHICPEASVMMRISPPLIMHLIFTYQVIQFAPMVEKRHLGRPV